MPNLFVTYVREDKESNITVFKKGDSKPYAAHFNHPNWDEIVKRALADDLSVIDLFDIAGTIHDRFEPLSDRVSVYLGEVYLDGDKMQGALADQICRFLREGVTDWLPLVAFFENLQANPSQRSRDGLYRWLDTHKFSITEDGMIVGYKGVRKMSPAPRADGIDGVLTYTSTNSGDAIIDGVWHRQKAPVPNQPGTIISLPRSQVVDDASNACARGLHVANFDFAKNFVTGGAVLEVHVHPRDVVSIPNDSNDAKMRVCRYLVVGPVTKPYERPLVSASKGQATLTQAPPEPLEAKHPSSAEWMKLVTRAKTRRRPITRLAEKQGWTLTSGADPKERTSWSI